MFKKYTAYIKDNPEKLWFKRKLYGWGWTPATWQGWLCTFLYVIFVLGFSLMIDENSSPNEIVFTFVLPVVLLTVAFIRLAYKKGEKPRWQWGKDSKES